MAQGLFLLPEGVDTRCRHKQQGQYQCQVPQVCGRIWQRIWADLSAKDEKKNQVVGPKDVSPASDKKDLRLSSATYILALEL